MAKEYKEACDIINKALKDNHPSVPNANLYKVRLFLIGHAFELLFKSILLSEGVSLESLKNSKKFGHNLVKLMQESSKYLAPPSLLKPLIEQLNLYYFEKELEYHKRGLKKYPMVTELMNTADELFPIVDQILQTKFVLKPLDPSLRSG